MPPMLHVLSVSASVGWTYRRVDRERRSRLGAQEQQAFRSTQPPPRSWSSWPSCLYSDCAPSRR